MSTPQKAAEQVYQAVDALNVALKEARLVGMEVNLSQEQGKLVATCMVPVPRRDPRQSRESILELVRGLVNRLGLEPVARHCGVTAFQVEEWCKSAQVPSDAARQKLEELGSA